MTRGDLTGRADVNYWRLTPFFEQRFSHPNYPLSALDAVIEMAQYGISELATPDPVGVPILRMNNLQNDGWQLSDLKYIQLEPDELETYRLQPGDLLFNRTNSKELVGKCEVFLEPGTWVFASYLIRVRVNGERVDPQFASDFLNTSAGRLQIDRLSRQIIGMTNINAAELRQILIPLPPSLSRQREFVAAMDAARATRKAKLDEAHALLASLDRYLLDTLALTFPPEDARRVFAVPLSHATGRFDPHFYLPRFEQVVRVLSSNGSQPLGRLVRFSDETWEPEGHSEPTFRYIEIGSIDTSTGEARSTEVAVADAPSRARMRVRRDDIIVSLTRPHHGAIAHIGTDLDGCVASTGFAVMREVDETQLRRDYLWCVLRTEISLSQMLQRASGGNYPAITESELAQVMIPVPSPTVQAKIAAEVRRRRDEACRLRVEAEANWLAAKRWFEEQLLGVADS